jgi:hypothetical protein
MMLDAIVLWSLGGGSWSWSSPASRVRTFLFSLTRVGWKMDPLDRCAI